MMGVEQKLRETARRLLREKAVGAVVGYARGSVKWRARPHIARSETEADRLVIDQTCGVNLAPYTVQVLRRSPGTKVAVVAKGCDGRALLQYVAEGQLRRDDVVIIGVACEGVLHREVQAESCRRCRHHLTPAHDLFVGEDAARANGAGDEFTAVAELERRAPAERWQWFEREVAKCNRCYACRSSCPMCYCEECFVDRSSPQWFGKSAGLTDTMLFHVVRALHVAGRCVDCGACERACPRGVKLSLLSKRLEREVRERFGYTAGLDPDAKPALA
ncbi:4Fe-4S ferredoxin, partial [candidate division WOR-3 bacterium]|nr:4Fe-4S ferredoxin [candidate division WOR-3 bacterium]